MSEPKGPRVFVTIARTGSQGRTALYRGPTAVQLRRVVLHTLARAAPQIVGDVSILVTGDRAMRALNRRYRDKDVATDVLAFPLGDGLHRGEPLGDVVVSHEAARRQARDYGATVSQEMTRLLVHGTLHLCGHDHHERREAARMHGLTRRLLRELSAHA